MSISVKCPNVLGDAKIGDIVCVPSIGLVVVLNRKACMEAPYYKYRVMPMSALVHMSEVTELQSFDLPVDVPCILYDVTLTPRS